MDGGGDGNYYGGFAVESAVRPLELHSVLIVMLLEEDVNAMLAEKAHHDRLESLAAARIADHTRILPGHLKIHCYKGAE
jgi:hypothetical protein